MRRKQPPLRGFLYLFLAAVIFLAGLVLGGDQLCRWDISRRSPYYPGAERVRSQHNFLRVRAIGSSLVVLSTDDDPETVREWFRQVNLELARKGRFNGLAFVRRTIEPNPDGPGTLIFYIAECGV